MGNGSGVVPSVVNEGLVRGGASPVDPNKLYGLGNKGQSVIGQTYKLDSKGNRLYYGGAAINSYNSGPPSDQWKSDLSRQAMDMNREALSRGDLSSWTTYNAAKAPTFGSSGMPLDNGVSESITTGGKIWLPDSNDPAAKFFTPEVLRNLFVNGGGGSDGGYGKINVGSLDQYLGAGAKDYLMSQGIEGADDDKHKITFYDPTKPYWGVDAFKQKSKLRGNAESLGKVVASAIAMYTGGAAIAAGAGALGGGAAAAGAAEGGAAAGAAGAGTGAATTTSTGILGSGITTGSSLGDAMIAGSIKGAGTGALTGGGQAAVTGGDVLKGALKGAGTGALTGGVGAGISIAAPALTQGIGQYVGNTAGNFITKAGVGAATGAVSSALQGKDIKQGAFGGLIGGVSGAAGGEVGKLVGGGTLGDVVSKLTSTAISTGANAALRPDINKSAGAYSQQQVITAMVQQLDKQLAARGITASAQQKQALLAKLIQQKLGTRG